MLGEPVADIALALAIDVMRGIIAGDRYVRAGRWAKDGNMPLTTLTGGKTAGIVGLGRIGRATAKRLEACGMRIAYYGRREHTDTAYAYYASVVELANACDLLVVSCPNTLQTRGPIDAEVLRALGPEGFLVNVARGAIVDERALITALESGAIAGAGLDVVQNEPVPSPALLAFDNVVVLPHIGGAARETRQAMFDVMIDNLRRHLAGAALLSLYRPA